MERTIILKNTDTGQTLTLPVTPASYPMAAGSYTVVAGDSLWAICKRFYGDGSLAYKLATANSIANPNLIYPGQVLTLPGLDDLKGYAATPAPVTPAGTTTTTTTSKPPSVIPSLPSAPIPKRAQTAAEAAEQALARAQVQKEIQLGRHVRPR